MNFKVYDLALHSVDFKKDDLPKVLASKYRIEKTAQYQNPK